MFILVFARDRRNSGKKTLRNFNTTSCKRFHRVMNFSLVRMFVLLSCCSLIFADGWIVTGLVRCLMACLLTCLDYSVCKYFCTYDIMNVIRWPRQLKCYALHIPVRVPVFGCTWAFNKIKLNHKMCVAAYQLSVNFLHRLGVVASVPPLLEVGMP